MGNIVVDYEKVTRHLPRRDWSCRELLIAIYEIQKGRIAKAWFLPGPKHLDPKPEPIAR